MNGTLKNIFAAACCTALLCSSAQPLYAGNRDRTGQSGALELLINPWAQGTGTFGANSASVRGLEAMKNNVGGLAFVRGTEFGVSHMRLLSGTGVSVNNLAFAQGLGGGAVIGVNVQALSFGDIPVTTYDNPDPNTGASGTYNPQFLNFQLGFAKEFSTAIHAGVSFTYVSEQIASIRASGACFDAGVQYQTGDRENFHFGVTLRNVGTNMRYSGSGLYFDTPLPDFEGQTFNSAVPSEKFQMPTYLNIAASYDFYLDENKLKDPEKETPKHRLTAMAAFTSNSTKQDFIHAGLEYGFRERVMLRAGYRYERMITNADDRATFYTGVAAGATVATNLGKTGPKLFLDYAYQPTARPANGCHTVSLRLAIGKRAPSAATDSDAGSN